LSRTDQLWIPIEVPQDIYISSIMQFDPDNKIIKLCIRGMMLEGEGKKDLAVTIFRQAWDEASSDIERFTSAHYLARHQETVKDKLLWDERALDFALRIKDQDVKGTFPSLYLNIGRCYEELNDLVKAMDSYEKANSFIDSLENDGYGKMISGGIKNGIERIKIKARDT
jgi:hypothetical protein